MIRVRKYIVHLTRMNSFYKNKWKKKSKQRFHRKGELQWTRRSVDTLDLHYNYQNHLLVYKYIPKKLHFPNEFVASSIGGCVKVFLSTAKKCVQKCIKVQLKSSNRKSKARVFEAALSMDENVACVLRLDASCFPNYLKSEFDITHKRLLMQRRIYEIIRKLSKQSTKVCKIYSLEFLRR